MPVELRHQRAQTFSGSVECDQRDARFANVRAGADLAGDAGQDALALTHYEDLVRAAGAPGPVAPVGEEGDRQIEHVTRSQAADRLLLKGGSPQFLVPGGDGPARVPGFALGHRFTSETSSPCHPRLRLEQLAGAEDDDPRVRSSLRDLGAERLRILLDRWEGVVVAGDDRLRADELRGAGGIIRTHREVVADRQNGDVDALISNEAHVAEESSVAGEVEAASAKADDQAGGDAVGHLTLAIPIRRAVPGWGELDRAAGEGDGAAVVAGDHISYALRLQPITELDGADHFCIVPFRHVDGVSDMVVVGVGEQDRTGLERLGINRGHRVVLDERIDSDDISGVVLEQERRVPNPGQFRHRFPPGLWGVRGRFAAPGQYGTGGDGGWVTGVGRGRPTRHPRSRFATSPITLVQLLDRGVDAFPGLRDFVEVDACRY